MLPYCAHQMSHYFLGVNPHEGLLIPIQPVPAPIPHYSTGMICGWHMPGFAKYSTTVLGDSMQGLVAKGNDAGLMVLHIPVPSNVTLPVVILAGSSSVKFGASKVLISVNGEAEPCGCCVIPFVPLSLNLACSDPMYLPTDNVVSPHTVMVGMSIADLIMGLIGLIVDMALSRLLIKLGDKLQKAVGKVFTEKVVANIMKSPTVERLIESYASNSMKAAEKELQEIGAIKMVAGGPWLKWEMEIVDKNVEKRLEHLMSDLIKETYVKVNESLYKAGWEKIGEHALEPRVEKVGEWLGDEPEGKEEGEKHEGESSEGETKGHGGPGSTESQGESIGTGQTEPTDSEPTNQPARNQFKEALSNPTMGYMDDHPSIHSAD